MWKKEHPFEQFLKDFIPSVARKSTQLNKAFWILETTGSSDAADLKADLDTELKLLFHDPKIYAQLLEWDRDPSLQDRVLKRQLQVLIRTFKQNQVPEALLEEISRKEALLAQSYANFRPVLNGKSLSENEILEILKKETNPEIRKKTWEASKQIGQTLAPQILELVRLRNQAAQSLGYSDYFQMQLDLQEVDGKWLLQTLDALAEKSDSAYQVALEQIERRLSERFQVPVKDLGPWAWCEPFCQQDPLDTAELDSLVQGVDFTEAASRFYKKMGVDIGPILARSDMEERQGKNQHAFCIHIDREGDVRTLNNVRASIKWLETVLHEIGHAIYEVGFDPHLPWLLREPPHMITTEAMALIAGRQAYLEGPLKELVGDAPQQEALRKKADQSLVRRQLIFSRWVLVMTAFESELYRDPDQDLNRLWWQLVEKYQKIQAPKEREGKWDWATKYHIGLAPVYYFSYLLGEMFASAIQESVVALCQSPALTDERVGDFLRKKLFAPGNQMPWYELVEHVTGKPLTAEAWLKEFAPTP